MAKKYTVDDAKKQQFASIYMLTKMIENEETFPILLEGPDKDLEPIFEYMMSKGVIEIKDKKEYVPTEKGRQARLKFLKRFYDFLKHYDIYCAVDLEEGSFAFEDYFEYDHDDEDDIDEWNEYLNEERWDDLRIAVAEFKKLDAVEIVFMSFINEARFGEDEDGWQFDLLLGTIWDDIVEICNSAISVDELGFEDDDGTEISGEEVITDVIKQGSELNRELKRKEAELEKEAAEEDEDEIVEEEVVTVVESYDVYDSYYRDPYYVSPWWYDPYW
jgi:DNA-binding PadR family transcriptional regulator